MCSVWLLAPCPAVVVVTDSYLSRCVLVKEIQSRGYRVIALWTTGFLEETKKHMPLSCGAMEYNEEVMEGADGGERPRESCASSPACAGEGPASTRRMHCRRGSQCAPTARGAPLLSDGTRRCRVLSRLSLILACSPSRFFSKFGFFKWIYF